MMAMPICDIMVIDKLLVNTQGANTSNMANSPQTHWSDETTEDLLTRSDIARTQ
jgi:hypothetical protein